MLVLPVLSSWGGYSQERRTQDRADESIGPVATPRAIERSSTIDRRRTANIQESERRDEESPVPR